MYRTNEISSSVNQLASLLDKSSSRAYSLSENTNEDGNTMSYVQAIKYFNCIVFSSDSRSTIPCNGGAKQFTDTFQKVGYACAGKNMFDDLPIVEYLNRYDHRTEPVQDHISLESIANEIAELVNRPSSKANGLA